MRFSAITAAYLTLLIAGIGAAEVGLSADGAGQVPTSGVFSLNVALYVKEDRREEFIKCIQANQEGTLSAEPLALQYDWYVAPSLKIQHLVSPRRLGIVLDLLT
jgi:hypothetical protein